MAVINVRIAGVNLPVKKHVWVSLTTIFGIGRSRALKICKKTNVNPDKKLSEITPSEEDALRDAIGEYVTEGDLRRQITANITELFQKKCYRGLRLRNGLPARGQNTNCNAKTARRCKPKISQRAD